jgi:hypothetical protein
MERAYARNCAASGDCRCARLAALAKAAGTEAPTDERKALAEFRAKDVDPSMEPYYRQPDSLREKARVAHHEAAHAVIGLSLGFRLVTVRIAIPPRTIYDPMDNSDFASPGARLLRLAAVSCAGRLEDEANDYDDWVRSIQDLTAASRVVGLIAARCIADSVITDVEDITRLAVRDGAQAISRVATELMLSPFGVDGATVKRLLAKERDIVAKYGAELDTMARALPEPKPVESEPGHQEAAPG